MRPLHPELRKAASDLDLARESRELLLATLAGQGESIVPNDALGLLWLLRSLGSAGFLGLIPLQKIKLLENLVNLIRRGRQEWVSRVCSILYEGDLTPKRPSSLLPEGMIRDLLRWVNAEKAEKVRENLWAILLRKEMGLAAFAKAADVAAGLCEKDPITRNNVIRFLFEHFRTEEVVDSLFQYSRASGKRIPAAVFKRYASLFEKQEDQQRKKYILGKILSTANLDHKEEEQIFSDYMNSLNRFDLIRLRSSTDVSRFEIADLKRKGRLMDFPSDLQKPISPHQGSFRERISLLMKV